jgi:hypothetical protein
MMDPTTDDNEQPDLPELTDDELYARLTDDELYARLTEPFDVTFRDLRGGVELEYITGEQVTSRLNEELGFLAWSFTIREHGIHAEADECWVLGELTIEIGGRQMAVRQQFGSQKIKRSRSSGMPLDIGFDLKGAATDALKKCASQVGVGLYLWKKEPPAAIGAAIQASNGQAHAGGRSSSGGGGGEIDARIVVNEDGVPCCQMALDDGSMCEVGLTPWPASEKFAARDPWWVAAWQLKKAEYGLPLCNAHQNDVKDGRREVRMGRQRGSGQARAAGPEPGAGGGDGGELFSCVECGDVLTETRFKDGTNWPAAQLAVFGRRKHSRVLCMTHYREANQAQRRAEEALQQVPF